MHIEKKTLRNIFIGAAACVILYWLLHDTERVKTVLSLVKGVLSPFLIGAGLAFILNVPMRAFERLFKKIPNLKVRRIVSILLTFLCFGLIVFLVFTLLIPELTETIEKLAPQMESFFKKMQDWIVAFLKNEDNEKLLGWVTDFLENFDVAGIVESAMEMVSNFVKTLFSSAFSALGIVVGTVVDVVIAVVFSLYCLFQKETLARQGRKIAYAFLPERVSDEIIRILRLANVTFSNFLSGQCIEVCILGCLFAVTMAIFRMPYIPLISVLVAVTAFVPIVGAWIGCALGAFFIFVENPIMALWFVIMFVVLQQIENNMIYPRVVGTSIGLSGMWVLLAVAVGGEVMGVAGMFLMIPITSVLYTLLRELTNQRLNGKTIDPDKLTDQPPELVSHFKQRRERVKRNRKLKKGTDLPTDDQSSDN